MFKRGSVKNNIYFNLLNATQSNTRIETSNGSRLLVNFGDGNLVPTTNISLATYSTPFTGTMSVSMIRGNTKFHIATYGNIVSNGNVRLVENQDVTYNTFKQISSIENIYFTTLSGSNNLRIIGTFSELCNDLPKLKKLRLKVGGILSINKTPYKMDITNIKNLIILELDSDAISISGNINNFVNNNPNIDSITIGAAFDGTSGTPISGSIESFSQSTIKTIFIDDRNTLTGNIGLLPASLGTFSLQGLNTTTGNIASLPPNLTSYNNTGNNTTTGDIASLPPNLVAWTNIGNNTTTGDIDNLPNTLINYRNEGLNTTTGSIANLPSTLTNYRNEGLNTTTGNIASLPPNLTSYNNTGNNTTTGDINSLPATLTSYRNEGLNTTTGDISTLLLSGRNFDTYYNLGYNTTTGSISNLSQNLRIFANGGTNSTSGNIELLPTSLTTYFNHGVNTTGGNIGSFSTNLSSYQNLSPLNTTTGDIATLKSGMKTFWIGGSSQSTYGNLYQLPLGISNYTNEGCLTASFTWSGVPKFWGNISRFICRPKSGFGLTSSEVDSLLNSFTSSNATWIAPYKFIGLDGNNGPRTSASDDAVLGLSALGVQVRVNGRFGAN